MELFSEIYSCYYQVLKRILGMGQAISVGDMKKMISEDAFMESLLAIIPKISEGNWGLFQKQGNTLIPILKNPPIQPMTGLQKAYLKAILQDKRIQLFLSKEQMETLFLLLADVEPLWNSEQFYFFDQYLDNDPYEDENYKKCFQVILHGCMERKFVEIDYTSVQGRRVHHYFCPLRMEYSVKNDKFRLLSYEITKTGKAKLVTLNMDRVNKAVLTDRECDRDVVLNDIIKRTYYKEPVTLLIKNRRNALERTMLHFANYEKNTEKLDEETYRCQIYYNSEMETELLIEIMSFGPTVKVEGNERMLGLIKERLYKQRELNS